MKVAVCHAWFESEQENLKVTVLKKLERVVKCRPGLLSFWRPTWGQHLRGEWEWPSKGSDYWLTDKASTWITITNTWVCGVNPRPGYQPKDHQIHKNLNK